ncbi:MAG: dynamin family protein [Gammaproteobacteria bacterium]|nr:dynamin family protein [Gammaproteobacteria bacterium]
MWGTNKQVRDRLQQLEDHLRQENPILVEAVGRFRELDRVARRMGLLNQEQSFATQVPWWPLITVLGTFSAGKSSFINHYLHRNLQATGTQAVDDKFSVLCFASDGKDRVLPGIALDADPRFPFYQMADEIERVSPGERSRVDAYLQLKTSDSEALRGYIIIDSPGFDADDQRSATLRITDYIIELSDLVLVFFDARHPEPGAMQDTLEHLVGGTMHRKDSNKFLYILNQIDSAAREDNSEQVVSAWQRALAQQGLTAGEFYTIYNPDVATPIKDTLVRHRYETKRDADMAAIKQRIHQVHVDRIYRIIGRLEKTAREIEQEYLPQLRNLLSRWRRGVLWRDGLFLGALGSGFIALLLASGVWQGQPLDIPGTQLLQSAWQSITGSVWGRISGVAIAVLLALGIHSYARHAAGQRVIKWMNKNIQQETQRLHLQQAFAKNIRPWHSVFRPEPVGWNIFARRRLSALIAAADGYIQRLNDQFTQPSGEEKFATTPGPQEDLSTVDFTADEKTEADKVAV